MGEILSYVSILIVALTGNTTMQGFLLPVMWGQLSDRDNRIELIGRQLTIAAPFGESQSGGSK